MQVLDFNPRTPCGVRPAARPTVCSTIGHFNPRTPCGVRLRPEPQKRGHGNFNPRTPCGVRLQQQENQRLRDEISIHAPLAGCDLPPAWRFQSRHDISIHAPLAGCDARQILLCLSPEDFNPRTPCGVASSGHSRFISIHAPLAGCDGGAGRIVWRTGNFNPRTPCGVRLPVEMECCHWNNFNPRTPCGVRLRISINNSLFRRFQSTHPLRGATIVLITVDKIIEISIHAPLAGCDEEAP